MPEHTETQYRQKHTTADRNTVQPHRVEGDVDGDFESDLSLDLIPTSS